MISGNKAKFREQLNKVELENLLKLFEASTLKLRKNKRYYDGEHDILKRPSLPSQHKSNNKVVNNYPKYITTIQTSYFLGIPVTYKTENKEFNKLHEYLDVNDEHQINTSHELNCSIYGNSFELLWHDSVPKLRSNVISPLNMFVVYDEESIDERIIAGFRVTVMTNNSKDKKAKTRVEHYTDNRKVYTYTIEKDKDFMISEDTHVFDKVPIIEFKNNDDRTGDFEPVITLIDSYNNLISDMSNNIENTIKAQKIITGAENTPDDVMQKNINADVMSLPTGADIKPLITQLDSANNTFTEKTFNDNIHKFSFTPDMGDENFSSNTSGVAMQYKLFSTDQIRGIKERFFKKALQERLLFLFAEFEIKGATLSDIQILFSKNTPKNETEELDNAIKMDGIVSQETQLGLLPESYGIDPQKEIEKIKAESDIYGQQK